MQDGHALLGSIVQVPTRNLSGTEFDTFNLSPSLQPPSSLDIPMCTSPMLVLKIARGVLRKLSRYTQSMNLCYESNTFQPRDVSSLSFVSNWLVPHFFHRICSLQFYYYVQYLSRSPIPDLSTKIQSC
jgi:hypothetical protein